MTKLLAKLFSNSKFNAIYLALLAIFILIALLSYNDTDPCLNVATDNLPKNLLFYPGSYSSDILQKIFGLASLLLPIILLSWSFDLYIKGRVSNYFFKILALILCLVSASYLVKIYNFKLFLPADSLSSLISSYYIDKNLNYFEYINHFIIAIFFISLIYSLNIRLINYYNFIKFVVYSLYNLIGMIKLPKIKLPHKPENAYIDKPKENNFKLFKKLKLDQQLPQNIDQIPEESLNLEESRKNQFIKTAYVSNDTLPDIDLLADNNNQNNKPQTKEELATMAERLLAVLGDFGVKGKIINVKEGPVVTMYEFEPAAGTKSSRVTGLSDDIARSLSALSTRIAVIPGRNALGIELPNAQRSFFRLKELIKTSKFLDSSIALPLILGKDLGGDPMIVDLAKMPHLLVAGTTGSGKSVAINAMIMSLLYRYTPKECRMIMIDPKMLELSAYDGIPHLMTPVVTEPSKAITALKWAVKEMENRYKLMSHLGVRNITSYNNKIADTIKSGEKLERKIQIGFDPETGKPIFDKLEIGLENLPFIVVIVDEMADLMLVAGKDIESSVQRLAQMARAAGIHIIMATQRPSVDVITGVIKANFPSRISFKVTSKIDSRTILAEQGAEQLLGMGDMLYMGNSLGILRVHGPFVDDTEVEKVTNFLRSTGNPEYIQAVTETLDEDIEGDLFGDSEGNDNLYNQALNIVKRERKASISYIQRSLRIGYNRAANLVEEMEKKGVLSAPNLTGKREILLPED